MAAEDIIIPLVMIILILIFVLYMIVVLIHSGWARTASAKNSDNGDRVSNDNAAVTARQCLAGQCAVNLQTGLKRCPDPTTSTVTVNPAMEVCSDPYRCSNGVLPYAQQADGSTNNLGICPPGITCACLRQPRCPEYVTSYFTRSNGNPYDNLNGQRITFPQVSSYVNLNNGAVVNSPPLSFPDPNVSFCSAPIDWLPFATPGCNFVSTNNMTTQDLEICMGAASACNGVAFNACLQGTLAVISPNPDNINATTVLNQQVACVAGDPCPCGQIAIYDTNFGGIVCKTI
jgi:hypothetical protein